MSDVNVSVSTTPIEIAFSSTPVEISIASAGVQGLRGVPGADGTGSSTSTVGITGVSISGGIGFTGNFNILAGSNITLSQAGNSLTITAASTSADVSGLISTGNADLRYLYTGSSGAFYASSNPSNYITVSNLQGLITTGDSDIRYLQTGCSGEFLKLSNLNGLINSGDVDTKLIGLITTGQGDLRWLSTGASGQFYPASNPNNFSSSGNVENTGTNLQNQITSIKNGTGVFIQNSNLNGLISSGDVDVKLVGLAHSGNFVSGISVTGGLAIQNAVNLLQGSNITLSQAGNNITISSVGGDGSSTNGVTGLSITGGVAISGAISLTGIDGLKIVQLGNTLQFSGSQGGTTNNITNNYSINSGSGIFIYRSGIVSGATQQFISFPTTLDAKPIVLASLHNDDFSALLNYQISGSVTTGFWVLLSEAAPNTGYYLDVLASNSQQTGMATNVIVNNITNNIGGESISGLISTGNADLRYLNSGSSGFFYPYSNPNQFIKSGEIDSKLNGLISTGSADLRYLQTGVSGEFYKSSNPAGYITNSNLNGLISTGSADLRYLTTGASGAFYSSSNPSNYITSANLNGLISTGQGDLRYLQTGVSGEFYKNSNPLNFSSSGNVENTGTNIVGLLNSYYLKSNPNQFSTSGNVELTGTSLQNQITTLNNLPKITGILLSGSGVSLTGEILITGVGNVSVTNSGNTIFISGNTGFLAGYYSTSNPSNYITSSNLNGLISTGQSDLRYLQTGVSGEFYKSSNPDGYITTANLVGLANSGNFVSGISVTGGTAIQNSFNINQGANISLVQQGANSLQISVTIPQGFATSGQVESTGTQIIGLLNSYYLTTNPNQYSSSGNVELTGTTLQNQISTERNKNTLTGVSISGGISITGALNINAGSNITLTQAGLNTFSISSSAGGGSTTNGVTGLSITGGISISGAIGVTGIGTVRVFQVGNDIQISGGSAGGDTINNNNYYVNSGSGLFVFQTNITSGVSEQFISFPTILEENPTVVYSIKNADFNTILGSQISGTNTSGYWLTFTDDVPFTGYKVNTFACNATGTGLATTVIVNQSVGNLNGLISTGSADTRYVSKVDELKIRTEIPSGSGNLFIGFNPSFSSLPFIWCQVQTSGDGVNYYCNTSGIRVDGFTALFSDTIIHTGVFLYTLAKI